MNVCIANNAAQLGAMAAQDIGKALRETLQAKGQARVIFAAAPSQTPMLEALLREPEIDWARVTAFHMDEYLGLPVEAPQRFGNWLVRSFFERVPLGAVHLMQPELGVDEACRSYIALLQEAPIDMVLLGVGTNGHLAFNDPPADLADPEPMRAVTLDTMCREQQVSDGCFPELAAVPTTALTLTIPTLLAAGALFCSVPGRHKSAAVQQMLEAPISGQCPATALRLHPHCTAYLDLESSSLWSERRA